MNQTVKKYLLIAAKHAVNAVMTNAALGAMFPQTFNFHDLSHFVAFLKAAGAVVLSRELMVWGPKILKWSQTGVEVNGNDEDKSQAQSAGKV